MLLCDPLEKPLDLSGKFELDRLLLKKPLERGGKFELDRLLLKSGSISYKVPVVVIGGGSGSS